MPFHGEIAFPVEHGKKEARLIRYVVDRSTGR